MSPVDWAGPVCRDEFHNRFARAGPVVSRFSGLARAH